MILKLREFLAEMAYARSDVESKITDLSPVIVDHLIKILKWEDELNYNKHLKDVNGWLFKVADIRLKGSKSIKPKYYKQWLFSELVSDVKDLTNRVNRNLNDYKELSIRLNDEDLYVILDDLFDDLTKDLSMKNFKDVRDYL